MEICSDEEEPKLEIVEEEEEESVIIPNPGDPPAKIFLAVSSNDVPIKRGLMRSRSLQDTGIRQTMDLQPDSNASEAIESLLLLGQTPVQSPNAIDPHRRRYSSSNDAVEVYVNSGRFRHSSKQDNDSDVAVMPSYYQVKDTYLLCSEIIRLIYLILMF